MAMTLDGSNGVTFNDSSLQGAAASPYVLKNRIINGDMRIDQRNAGASVSISNTSAYTIDRFIVYNVSDGVISVQQSTVAPNGFKNSMKITVTTADASVGATQYSFIRQNIEGFNAADLNYGSANAQTITVSFWVQSSVTGTFGGSIQNSAEDRVYAFAYTINAANTWEQKSVTITGDTTGTWLTTNGVGIRLNFNLGTGTTYSSTANTWAAQTSFNATGSVALLNTLNATFYITGVQLEIGSTATPFERRMYGQELALCQRYYYRIKSEAAGNILGTAWAATTTSLYVITQFPVTMRSSPSALEQSGTAGDYAAYISSTATTCNVVPTFTASGLTSTQYAFTSFGVASGLTAGQGGYGRAVNTNAYLGWSAEL